MALQNDCHVRRNLLPEELHVGRARDPNDP
jgi:hypothetical protein